MAFSGAFIKPFRPAFDAGLAAAVLTPTAGMAAWWKADALALANNDPVALWSDSSPNGHDIAQGTAAAKPTFKTNQVGGKPAIVFDGGDNLIASDAGMPTGDLSVICVVYAANLPVSSYYGILCYGTSGIGKMVFVMYSNTSPGSQGLTISQYGASLNINNSTGAWYIFSAVRAGTSYNLWRNNGSNASGTMITNTVLYGAGGMAIGSFSAGYPGSPLVGSIAEILVYNSALSTPDRNTTEQYLAAKYGLTLA